MNERRSISVVIPFYNEQENVPLMAARLMGVFDGLGGACECLMVNDGSRDGTRDAIEAVAKSDPRFRAVHLAGNFGQSAALITGMRLAQGDFIFTLDGDLQNDPEDLPELKKLLDQYDCVCGYRAQRNDTWVRRVSSRVANRVRNAILKDGLRDTGCGTKGFRRECIRHLVPFNGAHRFFAAVLRAAGMTITECPVRHHPRTHGVSKYGIGNRLGRGIYDLIGVRWLQRRLVFPSVEGGTD
jgi:dolichol-phosphate mannosyltransferase